MIKKLSLLILAVSLATSAYSDVTLNVTAGELLDSSTNSILDGALLQLVVSRTDSIFTAPTSTSFLGDSADDVILETFSLSQHPEFKLSSGYFSAAFSFTLSVPLPVGVTAGNQLILRWWPTLTVDSTTPGDGTKYGEFRTDVILDQDGADAAWVIPGNGNTANIAFITTTEGGSSAPSSAVASKTVTAVPEPSTFALAGVAVASLLALRRRRE